MLGITIQETRVYRDAKAEGLVEGRAEGRVEGALQEAQSLILRQLTRRFGELPNALQAQVQQLPLVQLETLGKMLLDFQSLTDLEAWLQAQS
jgi:predicted transposase YdaD